NGTRCLPSEREPCPVTYSFAPDRELIAWISVRNTAARDVTLDGVDEWLRLFTANMLVRPIAALDGGDANTGLTGAGVPFRSMILAPASERIIGITFRTTADLRYACAHWMPG